MINNIMINLNINNSDLAKPKSRAADCNKLTIKEKRI